MRLSAAGRKAAHFLLLALLGASPLVAQRVKSTLSGTITDASGAAVPGALVVLTNAGSGIASKFETQAGGLYTFPFLDPGIYSLTVTATGFKTATRQEVEIRVATDQRLDVSIEVGQVSERVEVKAEAPLLESVSATLGQVVDNKKISELPLNGRNVLSLLNTIPGASGGGASGSFATAVNPSINGTRPTGNNFTIEGVPVNQEYSGTSGGAGVVYVPQVDSISEFKVLTSNYSAEYGRAMGGVVAINLKSGTNEFHGSLFEFFRNDKLNARSFFASPSAPRPTLRFNQFGAAVGGPIVRNKLFFFADAEWTRRRGQATRVSTVPTAKMKTGDFSEDTFRLYDPTTTQRQGTQTVRQPYPGNRIPVSAMDPASRNLAGFWPDPTDPGLAANYNVNTATLSDATRTNAKIDWMLSERDVISGRFSLNDSLSDSGLTLPGPGNPNATRISNDRAPGLQVSYTRTFSPRLINELRVAFQQRTLDQLAEPSALADWRSQVGLPAIHAEPENQFGFPNLTVTGVTALGTPYDRFLFEQNNWNVVNTLTRTAGRHFVKIGGSYSRISTNDYIPNFPAGGYTFSGQFTSLPGTAQTGRGFGDFLLGWAQSGQAGWVPGGGMRPRWNEFALFLQDDWRVHRKLTLNLGLRYDVSTAPTTAARNFWTYVPSCNCNRPSEPPFETDWVNFGPRLGLAWQLAPKTVVRAGYGIAFFPQFKGLGGFAVFPPALQQNLFATGDPLVPAITFRDGMGGFVDPKAVSEVPMNTTRSTGIFLPQGNLAPDVQSWNFTLEHSPLDSLLLGASYVGNKGTHLLANRNVNTLSADLLGPPANFGGRSAQERRPYPGVGNVTAVLNDVSANYNSLQLKAEWRGRQGLTFLTAYTYGKAIDNNPFIQDPTNRDSSRGLAAHDVRQYFVHSMTYELPFGKGRRWLGDSRAADLAAGGWSVNSIFTKRTGYPVNPLATANTAGGFNPAIRPNRIANGNLPKSQRTIERWFDTTAFVNPPQFAFGNSGVNVIEGPGMFNWDFSAFKHFTIREGLRVQFRAESFNFTNTPGFGQPANTIGAANTARITGLSKENRAFQLALKLLF